MSTHQERIPNTRRRMQQGLMLMECVVYLGVWSVLASVGFALFYQVYTQSKHLTRGVEDVAQALKAGERWRGEVRASSVVPHQDRLPGAIGWDFTLENDAGRIVYRFTGTNVLRSTAADPQWREVLGRVKASVIERDETPQSVSWRWELELAPRSRRVSVEPRFTFQAVSRVQK
jgi:hypothetical protein